MVMQVDDMAQGLLLGLLATVSMDGWGWLQRRFLAIVSLDYRLLGRWLLHMREGRFCHHNIVQARPMPGERWLGWGAHHLVGALLGLGDICWLEPGWLHQPAPWPVLAFGLGTLRSPFVLMQPAWGAWYGTLRVPLGPGWLAAIA